MELKDKQRVGREKETLSGGRERVKTSIFHHPKKNTQTARDEAKKSWPQISKLSDDIWGLCGSFVMWFVCLSVVLERQDEDKFEGDQKKIDSNSVLQSFQTFLQT
jgi:hypothetical protein